MGKVCGGLVRGLAEVEDSRSRSFHASNVIVLKNELA